MHLARRRQPFPLITVLAEWVNGSVSLGKHVPAVVILLVSCLWGPTTLAAAFAAVCVTLGA